MTKKTRNGLRFGFINDIYKGETIKMQAIASQCMHHFKADAYIGQPNMHNYRAKTFARRFFAAGE